MRAYQVLFVCGYCLFLILGDTADVIRGVWFYEDTWQPLDEETAVHIESEHLSKFFGQMVQVDLTEPVNTKLSKPGLCIVTTQLYLSLYCKYLICVSD